MTRRALASLVIAALAGLAHSPHARGQGAPPLGWTEAAPAIAGEQVVAVAIGAAHDDDGPLSAARLAARRRGEAHALAAIQRWADDALAAVGAGARDAQAVHDAITARASVARVRARADGSAIVEVSCPLSALREAFDHPRLPWHRP